MQKLKPFFSMIFLTLRVLCKFVRKYTVTRLFTLLSRNFDYEMGLETFFGLNIAFFHVFENTRL